MQQRPVRRKFNSRQFDIRHALAEACTWRNIWRIGVETRCPIGVVLVVLIIASVTSFVPAQEVSTFQDHVAPILEAHCWKCHRSDERKAELDLTSLTGLLQGSESGPVVDPEDPLESRLLEVIENGEMPPEGDAVPESSIQVIRSWLEHRSSSEITLDAELPELTQHDVMPILLRRCAVCHGRQKQEGELDVRHLSALMTGGKSGPAIVPGEPDRSPLVQRIEANEMPPLKELAKYSVKPVQPAELEKIRAWIASGARWVEDQPDVATRNPDPLVSEDDRQHWAFQTPRLPSIPQTNSGVENLIRNPIDAFISRRLETVGLELSPSASKRQLIRRVTIDLTGLPPTPEEVEQYVKDETPWAYATLVERLLASPAYGERWGQYWIDLSGYADSEGVQHADPLRPHAYRYRDYVIRSFNNDKPYDRFLTEQIAGDELADYENADVITREIYDNLVATGFLRMSSDGTFAGITGFLPNRLAVIDDQIRVLTSATMGLTMRCARCHSHKFDPIPQRDYYRLAAVFKGASDEFDWLKPIKAAVGDSRYLPYVETGEREAWEAHESAINGQLDDLKARRELLLKEKEKVIAEDQTEDDAAGDEEAQNDEKEDVRVKTLDQQIKQLEAQKQPQPLIRALWDNGEPSPTYLLRRGDDRQPTRLVGPGVPSVLTNGQTPFEPAKLWPGANKTGYRLAFSQWLTRSDHPLTARVIVNRVWKHHFGRGMVEPIDDFGLAGGKPSHPDLLDWLSVRLVEQGWSLKPLHRLIVTSATYRQTSTVNAEQLDRDPDNNWYSRAPVRRMEAEPLWDALLSLASKLDRAQFGPPDPVTARKDGLVTAEAVGGRWRRSIYVIKRRTQRLTIFDNFDRPRMSPNCVDRQESTVVMQALHLLNNAQVHQLSAEFAQRVYDEEGHDVDRQIDRVFRLALGRPPAEHERLAALETLSELGEHWRHEEDRPEGKSVDQLALEGICHAVVNSGAFLYIE